MTAATDNRNFTGDGAGLGRDDVLRSWNGPIGAAAVLYTGALAGQLLTDTAKNPALLNYVADGTMRCCGFVTLGADNSAGALGARPVRVVAQVGSLVDKNAGGGSAIDATDIGKPAFGVDNQTGSKLSSDGPCIGVIVGIDSQTGKPMVLVDPVLAVAFDPRHEVNLILDAASELTIATGVVTITQSAHHLDTEGDAGTDDLDTISGGTAEQLLMVRPTSGSRTVVLKHNTGNIICPGGVDISLADSNDVAMLYYANSKWTVVAASLLAKPGGTFTQTYSTAGRTVAAATSHAIADSSGGTASTSAIAAETLPTSPGSGADGTTPNGAQWTAAVTQLTALRNAIATLAAEAELTKADVLALKQNVTAVIDDLQAAGISA